MKTDLIAKAQVTIHATPDEVWDALTNPQKIKQYMFDADVESDFTKGSRIVFTGEWDGNHFEEKGTILDAQPGKLLKYNSYNTQSEKPDVEENYHTITIELVQKGEEVSVVLTQDNNDSEEMAEQSTQNWEMMLEKLKDVVEESRY
ncbi:MAG: SRPBCC family protein [Bacteroidota bacterium]